MSYSKKPLLALTLIEVLIAIVVFSIWILAVLQSITSNMATTVYNSQRTQATLLAKEALELTFHKRDSNILTWMPRDCLTPLPQENFTREEVCEVTREEDSIYMIDKAYFEKKELSDSRQERREDARLLFDTQASLYNHAAWTWSIFARYITFTPTETEKIRTVSSHVLINAWRTWEVILTSLLWDYE